MEELPQNWVECTIGDVTTSVEKIDQKCYPQREIIYIDISGIDNLANRIAETKSFKLNIAPSRARQIVKSGDVLFSTVRPYLRNIAPVRAEFDGQIASTGFSVLRPATGIDASFLFLKAISKEFVDKLSGEQYGVSYPAVKDAQVRAQPFALPPTNEQRRIVEKIETLFARLDKGEEALREVQTLLARYRQSVLKAAVTGRLTADWRADNAHRLEHGRDLLARILKTRRETWQGRGKYKEPAAPDTTDLPELPEGWVWASVEQLSSSTDYGSSAKCRSESIGVPVLRMGNIVDGELDLCNLKYLSETHSEFPNLLLAPGDLLFNRTNSAELVGKTAVYKGVPEKCSFASYLIRVRMIGIDPNLVSAYINSVFGRAWVRVVVSQQVGQANVNGSKLKALSVPLPPAEEQKEVLARMTEHFSKMDAVGKWCQTELARSAALRQSILKDAFAGRLVPQDPADEPAAALLARIKQTRAAAPGKTRRKARA